MSPCGTQAAVRRDFIALYTLAQIGAFIGFVPLLQILVPLRASLVDHAHAARLLSTVGLSGAVAASIANIVFGALSDRTRARRGSRRPWVIGGLAATLGCYALVWRASTPAALLLGVVAFQVAFNAAFAPIGAVVADDVPDRQKGMVSALLGLGYPLGSLAGAAAVSVPGLSDGGRYLVVGVLVGGLILPFAWRLRPVAVAMPAAPRRRRGVLQASPLRDVDFRRAWAGRLLVMIAFSLVQGYLLLFLQDRMAATGGFPARPEAAFTQLAAISTTCNIGFGLLGGWWSDRAGRRKPFVIAAGAGIAAGLVCIAVAPGWETLQAAMVLYSAGAGLYYAVDLALMLQLLPSLEDAGQDLGVVNLSNTVPQIIAPLIGLGLLRGPAPDYRMLFLVAAATAIVGALCVRGIKRTR